MLLHAIALALAGLLPRPQRTPQTPIELEIVEVPAPEPEPPRAEGPPAATPGAPGTPPRRGRVAAPGRLTTPAPAHDALATPGRVPAPPPVAGEAPAPPAPDLVLPDTVADGGTVPSPPPAPNLVPPDPWAVGGTASPEEPEKPEPPAPVDEAARLAAKVTGILTEEQPRERARLLADPSWNEVRHRLEERFVVPEDLAFDRAGGGLEGQLQETGKAWKAYLVEAKRYGATGDPYAGEHTPEVPHTAGVPDVDAVLSGFDRSQKRYAEPGESATRIVTWVEVAYAEDGTPAEVRVTRGSGLPGHDRIAVEAVRGVNLDAPPPAGQRRVVFAFETATYTVPPMPVAGCSVYTDFEIGTCYWPLRRLMKNRVRLEALP